MSTPLPWSSGAGLIVLASLTTLTTPVHAQEWSGLEYTQSPAPYLEELELRRQFDAGQEEETSPPPLSSPAPVSVPDLEVLQEKSPDEQIRSQPHLLPRTIPGIIPTAVHDPHGDLDGTPCVNKFYRGRALVVDISQQRAHVYEPKLNKNVFECRVVESFRVTTAKNGRVTPTGDFHLAALERTTVAGYAVDWMTFTYQGKEFWGIHPAPWQKANFGEEWYRQNQGSLGCIRFDPRAWARVKKYTFTNMFLQVRQ